MSILESITGMFNADNKEKRTLKIAINGFGRIGRSVARIIESREDVELVAINDISNVEMLEYLAKFDSVHSEFPGDVVFKEGFLHMGSTRAKFLSETDPQSLDFASYGAEVVLECTGVFLTSNAAQAYIDNGIKKVILSAPARDDETPTYVLGVNADQYSGESIISNASCTTNCLGPVVKILDDHFGVEKGVLTTIHSYTNDQNILDSSHDKDKRRARAAATNIIPTSTGAAKAMKLIMPHLENKLHGQSVRVPTPNVSMVDFNVLLSKETSADEINAILEETSASELKGILEIDTQMKVSSDIMGNSNSSIVAKDLTQVIDGNLVKVMSWYDNEWGYSNRLIDMAIYISQYETMQ
jgi:glyceraldehyde 3-phosphate dehydrogenase